MTHMQPNLLHYRNHTIGTRSAKHLHFHQVSTQSQWRVRSSKRTSSYVVMQPNEISCFVGYSRVDWWRPCLCVVWWNFCFC